jgi:hypothetical protein
MKIIYIFTSPTLTPYSVQNKVLSQINGLTNAGVMCYGAFFTTLVQKENKYSENVNFYPVNKSNKKYFNDFFQRRELDKTLWEFISKEFDNTDFFYVRYPGATRQFVKIAKKFGNKIVLEHQSKELDEIQSLMVANKFGFKPSKLLSWLQYSFIPYFLEYYFGPKISRYVKASVAVTNEIGSYQKEKGCKNVIVITNGINTRINKLKNASQLTDELCILFLKGSSGYSPWNGFDRLINSIDEYIAKIHNGLKIKLLVYGFQVQGEIPQRDYIFEGGFVTGSELDNVFQKAHIGVSGIQVYLKNFKEATSLKVREYTARGLPFFYAYTDPDLNADAKEFCLEFPNDDSLIDMEKVIEFAKKALEDKDLPQKMRKYAEEHMDYEVKMKKLYQELQRL